VDAVDNRFRLPSARLQVADKMVVPADPLGMTALDHVPSHL
jgi:hypothetical protein